MNLTNHHKEIKSAALLSIGLALLFPLMAMAQATPESFEPGDKDLTGYLLRSIFGAWSTATDNVPVLGPAMRVLNLFALTFGTLMFTYVAVIGTLNSAQDGELLGRKWSSMWVPLRFVFGTSMLVPLASGYSAAQHLILWLALVGGGAASIMWNAALEGFANPLKAAEAVSQSEDYIQKTNSLARNILQAEVCSSMLQAAAAATTGEKYGMTSQVIPRDTSNSSYISVGGHKASWGGPVGSEKGPSYCGSVVAAKYTDASGGATDPMTGSSYQLGAGAVGPSPTIDTTGGLIDGYEALANAQFIGVRNAQGILGPFARGLTASGSTATDAQINAAVFAAGKAYRDATVGANTGVGTASAAKLSKFIVSSQDTGWLMASSSFFQMARIRSAATAVMNTIPSFNKEDSAKGPKAPAGVAEGPLFEDMGAIESRINDSFAGDSSDSGWFNIGKRITQLMGETFSVSPSNKDHALVQIKDKGDYLLYSIETLAVASVTTVTLANSASNNVAGKVVNFVTGIGSTFKEVVALLTPAAYAAFIALFGVAMTMSFLIPMLPFMLSIGSILGWLMAVFSAVVAAPIWLAGHLHPEGDGFAGRGAGGYMILLETVTRPLFIVLGLIGAFVIMDPMLKFVAWSFRANLSSVQGGSTTGIISIVVFAMIYVAIVFTVVRTSLSLIHSLSEKVYTWIGGAHAGYDQAGQFGKSAQQSISAATSSIQGVGKVTAGTASTRAVARMKDSGGGGGENGGGDDSPRGGGGGGGGGGSRSGGSGGYTASSQSQDNQSYAANRSGAQKTHAAAGAPGLAAGSLEHQSGHAAAAFVSLATVEDMFEAERRRKEEEDERLAEGARLEEERRIEAERVQIGQQRVLDETQHRIEAEKQTESDRARAIRDTQRDDQIREIADKVDSMDSARLDRLDLRGFDTPASDQHLH